MKLNTKYISKLLNGVANERLVKSAMVAVVCIAILLLCIVFQRYDTLAVSGQQIASKATELAWGEGEDSSSPKSAFSDAANSLGLSDDNDCLRFVQTVVRASGVDDNFPIGEYGHGGGVDEWATVKYMNNSGKWGQINTTNEAELQPGDILVSAVDGSGNNHIFIYLGDGKVASANQGYHYGRVGNLSNEWCSEWGGSTAFQCVDNPFQVFRLGGSNGSSTGGHADSKLSDYYAGIFSQNNIYGWNPNECTEKPSSGLCGDTATAIYWSALSKYIDDPVKVAGVVGNLANEGGMNPVAWEGTITNSDGSLTNSWDSIYGGALDGTKGVGAFGITSGLSEYLHYINDNYPDLVKYFQDGPEYNFNYIHPGSGVDDSHPSYGDVLLEKIGKEEFGKLVEAEVKYAIEDFNPPRTQDYFSQSFSSPYDAAVWWMDEWERPAARNPDDRGGAAQKAYDEFNGMVCTGSTSKSSDSASTSSSSSSTTVTGDDVTWIGDSYSVQADNKGLLSEYFSGLDTGPGANNTASSYIQGSKFVSSGNSGNPSCLSILEKVIGNGELRPYLVFACGNNGGWSDDDISKFQELLDGQDTKAVVVTSQIPSNDYADSNNRLRAMAESNDNIYLADWTSAYDASYFDGDPEKIHPITNPGYEKWVGVISDTLSGLGSCTSYEGEYPQYAQQTDYTCGQASMAMLATVAAGEDVTEDDVIKITGGDSRSYANTIGSGMTALDKMVGDKYGFEVVDVPVNESDKRDVISKMRQYLNDGYMIHLSGEGSSCPYPVGAHYIGIFALDGDTAKIANSGFFDQCSTEMDLSEIINAGYHGGSFAAIKGGGNRTSCDSDICAEDDSGGLKSGGFTSVEEAESAIMNPYRELANNPSQWAEYHLTSDEGPYNCFSFSNYFITKYTSINFYGVPGVDGGGYAEEFYNIYHGEYPEITLSDTPTPYSVAGCGAKYYAGDGSASHTFIVLGVDATKNTMIYGQAAYGSGSAGILAGEISLDANDPYHVGPGCQYADFSKYLKGI
ncbi:MAG: hypothetical protein K6G49_00870 [Candidatus Saccharibacteria bacterium]|nr:hypothetical protein [Candidatus Saccharibacteria bacterium]